MCVLALFVNHYPGVPLIVAANRDESFARPSTPPQALAPGVVAGKDLLAGGTWFGVNDEGLLVAVTNRRAPAKTPTSASRGLLALEALRCGSLG